MVILYLDIIKGAVFMDIFKKIYTTLIFLTIIALSYLCLVSLGAIKIDITNETTMRVMTSALSILIMSVLFSRTANVIANRNARIIGYLGTFSGLINLILVALSMIITKNEIINNASNIMLYITIFIFLIVLVFEIPRSNSAHGKFQIITAVIIGLTAIFPYATGLKKINSNPLSFEINTYELEENKENNETLNNINTILTFMSIGAFLINPMLRVFYIDKDYYALNEINEALTSARTYQENEQYNANYENLSDKYKTPTQTTPTPVNEVSLPPQTIKEIEPTIQEMPQEKVINEQYHPDELPEAIIPSITGISETTVTPVETSNKTTPTVPDTTPDLTQQINSALTSTEQTPSNQPEPQSIPNNTQENIVQQPETVTTPTETNQQ